MVKGKRKSGLISLLFSIDHQPTISLYLTHSPPGTLLMDVSTCSLLNIFDVVAVGTLFDAASNV